MDLAGTERASQTGAEGKPRSPWCESVVMYSGFFFVVADVSLVKGWTSLLFISGTRFKEGCNINRSLSTLGQVIKKLSDESQKYESQTLTKYLAVHQTSHCFKLGSQTNTHLPSVMH